MRIEKHHGRFIVCGHIYPTAEIAAGQIWQDPSGNVVTVERVDDADWVTYFWQYEGERFERERDVRSFQSRYCRVVDDPAVLGYQEWQDYIEACRSAVTAAEDLVARRPGVAWAAAQLAELRARLEEARAVAPPRTDQ